VLATEKLDMTPVTLSHFAVDSFSQVGVVKPFEWYYKFKKPLVVNFNSGTTASVANVVDNSLHVIGFTTNGTSANSIVYNARIRFIG